MCERERESKVSITRSPIERKKVKQTIKGNSNDSIKRNKKSLIIFGRDEMSCRESDLLEFAASRKDQHNNNSNNSKNNGDNNNSSSSNKTQKNLQRPLKHLKRNILKQQKPIDQMTQ